MDDCLPERLRLVLNGLKQKGLNPQDYLYLWNHDIQEDHYRDEAMYRLESHQARARNRVFQERFTKGYVFPPLPPFRGAEAVDGGSFEDFVNSFCESILNGLAKQSCKSRIVLAIRDQFDLLSIRADRMTPEKLKERIQSKW